MAFFFPLQAACIFFASEQVHPSSKPQDLATILIINEEPNGGGTSKEEVPRSRAPFLREQTGFKIEGRGVSRDTLKCYSVRFSLPQLIPGHFGT